MRIADLRTLYAYNCWMNDRILEAASRVTPEFTALTDLTPRNLQDNLAHILDVEWSWRERVRGAPEEVWRTELMPAGFPDVDALKARWEEEEAVMRDYLDSLSDEDLQAPFQLRENDVAPALAGPAPYDQPRDAGAGRSSGTADALRAVSGRPRLP